MNEYYDTYAPSLNENFRRLVATSMISDVENHNAHGEEYSRTEIDSHANITVVARHVYVLLCTVRMADVNPYTPYYEPINIQIVNESNQYDYFYNGRTYILVI